MRLTIYTCAASLIFGWLPGAVRADELPRYKLPPGRQITSQSTSTSKDDQGRRSGFIFKTTSVLTVLRENDDGSRRVVVRNASVFTQKSKDGQESEPVRVEFVHADVFPDGRVKPNRTTGVHTLLPSVSFRLPDTADEMNNGWTFRNEEKLETTTYTPISNDDGVFDFTTLSDGPFKKIYDMDGQTTVRFDRGKGLIVATEGTHSQGKSKKGTSQFRLISDDMLPREQLAQLESDFDRFFDAHEQYSALMKSMDQEPDRADERIEQAKAVIATAQQEVVSDLVKSAFATVLDQHETYAQYAKDSAERLKEVLNQPAADWSSTDIDGNAISLADLKGKVVVMDFWYRNCGWCIYAMPQVKQLAEDYKDKPVVVLGMNTDRDEADAKFVIDVFQLNYATVKAEGIPEKYGVRGYPTLIVIDRAGVVRDIHVGYSPTLRQEVGKKIDELLESTIGR